ncbi:MAG: hypothetical protein E6929_06130 [Clostridium sp.]|nr:hypothetical protein [Clostridium sp.]
MNKKKLSLVLATIMIASSIALVGCGNKDDAGKSDKPSTEQGQKIEDKTYTYTLKGEKDSTVVTLTYKDGKPVDGSIDVITDKGSKRALSEKGEYVMKEGEEKHWHEQADLLINFLKENNFDLSKVTVNEETKTTDAVSGVSIKVKDYMTAIDSLMKEVEAGTAKEAAEVKVYTYTLKGEKDSTVVEMTYEDGKPVDATIDVTTDKGSKRELSEKGEYVMKEGEEKHWHEQADLLTQFLKDNNFDLSKVTVNEETKTTDAVSGVSIKVKDYVTAIDSLMKEVEAGTAKEVQ